MTKTNKKYLCIVAMLFVLAVAFSGKFIMASSLSFYWHITNNSTISNKQYKIHLPFNWWVISKTEHLASLAKIPSIGEGYFANVFIADKLLTKSKLSVFPMEKEIQGDLLRREPTISTLVIDSQVAFGVEYVVYKSAKNEGKVYITWTIPSKNIVISGIEIDMKYRDFIKTDLVDNIEFR
jgi:hypothetical protein